MEDLICTQLFEMPLDHRAAADRDLLWDPGDTIRIKFIGASPVLQKKIAAIASEWLHYANLRFAFGAAGAAEVRVAFQPGKGSWSYIGTTCLRAARTQPTMNLGWLTEYSYEQELRRVVLHEFGHVLGLVHEHSSPAAHIPWDEDAVYEYYQRTQGWSHSKTKTNVLLPEQVSLYTEFDPDSIMLYAIPKSLTLGGFEIPWSNCELSDTDKAFAAKLYPKAR